MQPAGRIRSEERYLLYLVLLISFIHFKAVTATLIQVPGDYSTIQVTVNATSSQ
ncbi:MAG: hypothetical protein KJ970_13715 [Candidatus Eisenbacteria bacterium]|uniref:Uncharacterized protein n=1 Tax=Eiseniibacteriota bacterium TaxID=2212470 RepID=A0A948W495_UNCEI|nr:hypothetical protein [Candidatus Eisenbacteria bacterium]MBU2691972.1 hypothetical protein [Candidatus Eisenbacteria bacterium]